LVTSYKAAHPKVPVLWLNKALGLSKQGWYHTHKPAKDRTKTKEQIIEVLGRHSYYGHKRVTKDLKHQGIIVNHKVVFKIMGDWHLLQVRSKKAVPRTTNSNHRLYVYQNEVVNLGPIIPGWVWVSDITYIATAQGWVYLALIMDIGSRRIVGWAISTSMHRQLCIDALQMALAAHTAPKIHHSDRGVQYCSYDYIAIQKEHNILPSMAAVGVSVDNPYAESLNRSIKVEEVYRNSYDTIEDARKAIGAYITCYNTTRLHSSLGYRSPAQYEAHYLETVSMK
jgi:putative transposase